MGVVEGRVDWICDERTLVALKQVDQSTLEILSVIVFGGKCIGLILSATNEVLGSELEDEGDGHVQLCEQEQIEEVGIVLETERLNDTLVSKDE